MCVCMCARRIFIYIVFLKVCLITKDVYEVENGCLCILMFSIFTDGVIFNRYYILLYLLYLIVVRNVNPEM